MKYDPTMVIGTSLIIITAAGALLFLAGLMVHGNSGEYVDMEGELVDKISYATGRRDIVVRLDDGSYEREARVDDKTWYDHEEGDRIVISVYVTDPDQQIRGIKFVAIGAVIGGAGWLTLNVWGRRPIK